MRRTRRFVSVAPAIAIVAAFIASSCGKTSETVRPVPGVPPGESRSAQPLNFTNGPPSPGPYIVRFENAGSRVITTDPAKQLIAIHGLVTDLPVCTDASTRVPVDIQIVLTPSQAQAINLYLTGRANQVSIYSGSDTGDLLPFDPAKFCPFITQTTPLYRGEVQYRLHINGQGNLLFQWQGFVTRTSDGATFHYVENQFAVPGPDGTVSFIIEDIQLVPLGSS